MRQFKPLHLINFTLTTSSGSPVSASISYNSSVMNTATLDPKHGPGVVYDLHGHGQRRREQLGHANDAARSRWTFTTAAALHGTVNVSSANSHAGDTQRGVVDRADRQRSTSQPVQSSTIRCFARRLANEFWKRRRRFGLHTNSSTNTATVYSQP